MPNATSVHEIAARLLEPFDEKTELEWIITACGGQGSDIWAQCTPYVDNRAIQRRLDAVVGAFNWRNEFKPGPDDKYGGVVCGISIRHPETGEWITKHDGAEGSKTEPMKGGLSNAMKRAAVQWGIGRYLYDAPEPYRASISKTKNKIHCQKWNTKAKENFYWAPPALNLDLVAKRREAEAGREIRRMATQDPPSSPATERAPEPAPTASQPPTPPPAATPRPEAAKALEFIRTCPADKLDACEARLAEKAETYSREESQALKTALANRRQELGAAVAQGLPTGADLLRNRVRAKLVEMKCPPAELDDWLDACLNHADRSGSDPVEFAAGAPWVPKATPKPVQQSIF